MNKLPTTWLELEPVDTLFFGATESMVAGENHEADTLFPPMPATLAGALRTALLRQKGITPKQWLDDPGQWTETEPMLGFPEKPGFEIIGPLFRMGKTTLYPAPAHWMSGQNKKDCQTIRVQAARPLTKTQAGLTGSVPTPFWVTKPAHPDLKSLAGCWITSACFKAMRQGSASLTVRSNPAAIRMEEAALLPAEALYRYEERTGIALTRHRTVKEGHLYSCRHIRLTNGLRILVGIMSNHAFSLSKQDILQLGGEQRICMYQTARKPGFHGHDNGNLLYALSPLHTDFLPAELKEQPRAAGRLLRIGGWDMKKRFHKPLVAFWPAGTVFVNSNNYALSPQCITI